MCYVLVVRLSWKQVERRCEIFLKSVPEAAICRLVIRQDLQLSSERPRPRTHILAESQFAQSPTMLSTARLRVGFLLARRAPVSARRAYAFSANEQQEINNPNPPKEVPNVSKTNELPMETPHQDAPVQESVEDGERMRVMQAPNRATVWSLSQNPRARAMTGPRFEQTLMEYQVGASSNLDGFSMRISL